MAIGVQGLKFFCDSQLVALQMLGEYEARSEQMIVYHKIAKTMMEKLEQVFIGRVSLHGLGWGRNIILGRIVNIHSYDKLSQVEPIRPEVEDWQHCSFTWIFAAT